MSSLRASVASSTALQRCRDCDAVSDTPSHSTTHATHSIQLLMTFTTHVQMHRELTDTRHRSSLLVACFSLIASACHTLGLQGPMPEQAMLAGAPEAAKPNIAKRPFARTERS